MKFISRLAGVAAVLTVAASCAQPARKGPAYLNPKEDIEVRVQDALSRMTLEEKVKILHAQSKFSSAGVPRLGIPELWTSDGPHGVRAEVLWDKWATAGWTNDSIVAFPALTCLAATWNRDMAAEYGKAIGEEALYRGKDVLLGPGVNIARTPLNGRNFEYMGEDPYLAGEMCVPYIKEVQKNGVATCVKHYCLNNEETHRFTVDVDVDDRALYEIYLPAFKKAVLEGGTWSIMGSYNLYRGQHACHNDRLLNGILKGEWGFDGAVISDWGGCHDTDEAAANGLDLEFGTGTNGLNISAKNAYDKYYLALPYLEGLRSGKYDEATLNDKAARVLRLMFRTSMAEHDSFGSICNEEHYAAARKIADEGIVLLRNESGNLPIAGAKKILVVGENAVKMMTVGGGSSSLKVQREISPLAGLTARATVEGAEVVYARGYVGSQATEQDGLAGQSINDSRSAEELIAEAVALAKDADQVLFIGGLNKDENQDCEGADRLELGLPYGQDAVIAALAEATDHLSVVLVSGNPVAMPWRDDVESILQAWYIGSEAGEAIADVVFGDVNPSGKLPFTYPAALSDSPAHLEGMSFPNDGPTYYNEGIFVGYRWFENMDIEPLYAFGHGLSYTTFEYSAARIAGRKVKVTVKNTGERAGAEVVQLYIADVESSLPRPVKELKGFEKVYLQPGESKTVTFTIADDDLKFFDADRHEWVLEPGEFKALVGAASDDIKAELSFKVK